MSLMSEKLIWELSSDLVSKFIDLFIFVVLTVDMQGKSVVSDVCT